MHYSSKGQENVRAEETPGIGGHPPVSGSKFPKQTERLRRGVPIAAVISEYTKLHGSRNRLRGDCPLHETPAATLRVYPYVNTFRCLFCGIEGDVITFLEIVEGLTHGQALEALETIYYSDDERDAA